MAVTVKLSTTLRDYVKDYNPHEVFFADAAGKTAGELAQKLGLPLAEVHVVMINGQQGSLEQTLAENDRVAYFPAVGGG